MDYLINNNQKKEYPINMPIKKFKINRTNIYEMTTFVFLVWFVLQDFILSIIYGITGSLLLTNLIFYSKDVFLVLFFIVALFKVKLPLKWICWTILYLLLVMCYIFVGYNAGVELFKLFSSTRLFLYLPCLVTIGFATGISKRTPRLVNNYMKFLVFVAIVGIVEVILDKFIGTKKFWTDIVNLTAFLSDVKKQGNLLYQGLPANFYGAYGGEFFSQKRLVSFFANPLTAGYVLILPYLYYLVKFVKFSDKNNMHIRTRYLINTVIMFIAIILTFTRGIILPMLVLTVIYIFKEKKNLRFVIVFSIILIGIIAIILYRDKIISYIFDSSTYEHVKQLTNSILKIRFLGYGVGTFGVLGFINTESTYVTIMGQLGVIGLLMYLYGVYWTLKGLYRCSKKIETKKISIALGLVSVIYYFTGIISEQLLAYTSIAPYYILVGITISSLYRKNLK